MDANAKAGAGEALLGAYESAAKIMSQMLVAARQNAWDKVTELEESYLIKIEAVKRLEKMNKDIQSELSSEQRVRKQALIQGILSDDGAIRELLFPVMHRITDMIFDAQVHARMRPDIL